MYLLCSSLYYIVGTCISSNHLIAEMANKQSPLVWGRSMYHSQLCEHQFKKSQAISTHKSYMQMCSVCSVKTQKKRPKTYTAISIFHFFPSERAIWWSRWRAFWPFSQFLSKKDLQPSFLSHSTFSVSHCSEKNVGECRGKRPFFQIFTQIRFTTIAS